MKKTYLILLLLSLSNALCAGDNHPAGNPDIVHQLLSANGGMYALAGTGTIGIGIWLYTWYQERADKQKNTAQLVAIINAEFKKVFELMLPYKEYDLLREMNHNEELKKNILHAIAQRDVQFPHLDIYRHILFYKDELKKSETNAYNKTSAEILQLHQSFNNMLAVLGVYCKDIYQKEYAQFINIKNTENRLQLNATQVEELKAKIALLTKQEEFTEAQKQQILQQGSEIAHLQKTQDILDQNVRNLAQQIESQKEQMQKHYDALPDNIKNNFTKAFFEWQKATEENNPIPAKSV
ncbi:MAG: hypothetical protein WD055_00165 [Candidatus Dependentiae bacterium]